MEKVVVVCVEVPYKYVRRFARVRKFLHLEIGMIIRAYVESDVWSVTVDTIETSTESELLIAYCDFRDEHMTREYEDNPEKCDKILSQFEEDPSWQPFGDYQDGKIPDGPSEATCLEMLKAYAAERELK